jgi:hypothetical protein
MARTRAGQAAAEAFGKVGTVTVPRDANGTEAAVGTPAAPPAPQGPAQRRAAGKRAPAPPPESVPEIDDPALLATWRWTLGAKALKAAATRTKAEAAMAEWQRVVADAEQAGVPARLVVAAAAGANLDM